MQKIDTAARKTAVNRVRKLGFELIKSDAEMRVVEVAPPAPLLMRELGNCERTSVEVSGVRFVDVAFDGIHIRWRG